MLTIYIRNYIHIFYLYQYYITEKNNIFGTRITLYQYRSISIIKIKRLIEYNKDLKKNYYK